MTTFYSIHAYNQESYCHADKDLINNYLLYSTFEDAIEAIEEVIIYYAKRCGLEDEVAFPVKMKEYIKKSFEKYDANYMNYFEFEDGRLFVIARHSVVFPSSATDTVPKDTVRQ
jgi:hypothetical protein